MARSVRRRLWAGLTVGVLAAAASVAVTLAADFSARS
jgi:hypothetical protein